MQVEGRVLHVDKGGVEPGEANDLDDLRIGDPADMGAEREPAPLMMRLTRFSCMASSRRNFAEMSMGSLRSPSLPRYLASDVWDGVSGIRE